MEPQPQWFAWFSEVRQWLSQHWRSHWKLIVGFNLLALGLFLIFGISWAMVACGIVLILCQYDR